MSRPPVLSKAPVLPRRLVFKLFVPPVAFLYRSLVFKLSLSGRSAGSALLALQVSSLFSFSYSYKVYQFRYSFSMAESLLAKLGDLNFTAEEQDAIVVVPESDDKVQTITEINPIFFLIAFASSSNRDNVLKRGPWDFQKDWFALEPTDPACTIHDYAFRYMCIWVRIHNIPLSLMTEALARTLGACIGKVVMTDTQLEDAYPDLLSWMWPHWAYCSPMPYHPTRGQSEAPVWCLAPCPLPKRVSVARSRGRVSVVKDADVLPLSPASSVASSPPASASAAAASVPAPAASAGAALVPVSVTVGFVPSDAPVAAGRTAAVSAPLSEPSPRGKGRAITDNILVAHELVHTLHTSVSRSSQGAVFKLDMEKAFDRVEWPFLQAVMLRLGFDQPWVDLIMRCVSSVSSRVRLRGTLSEAFLPRCGLRQGDPLSPFLFLFCTEGLSAALTAAQRKGRLPGVRASKHGPPVNHLLFADDSLVFLRNDMSEVHYLKDILSTYSAVSGQKVNFSKSTAYFSPRTPPEYWVTFTRPLVSRRSLTLVFTLGFPSSSGRTSTRLLAAIATRWTLAFPSGKGSTRGWPFVAWDDLCQPKAAGGMGFKDLHLFNIALLGKQLWRLLSEPGSLLYRTFRAKYFPDGDLLHASVPVRSSFAWKGLHHALSRLRDGFFCTLGIDSQVRMFRDRWGGFSPVALNDSSTENEELPLRCRDFMVPGQPLWDRSKLLARLSSTDVEKIVEVPISSGRVDTLIKSSSRETNTFGFRLTGEIVDH
ncbi:hypothetical protein GQ457_12G014130 [Hibiscus cannabinus]